MVSGVASNLIENFANLNENFQEQGSGGLGGS